jgi:sulfate-transporting ATPase
MADKIIFQLQDLKKYFGQVEVLKGITLSFLEGAKIGLIGPNGAGKSTLLRIMSGEDKQFEGTAMKVGDYSIGYLSQEPPLTESKDVAGNLREAVQPLLDIKHRYNDLTEQGEMGEEYDKLFEEMDHKGIWDLDGRLEQAATALDLPPMDADVKAVGWRAPPRRAVQALCSTPTCCCSTSPPTTSTPTRSSGSSSTSRSTRAR